MSERYDTAKSRLFDAWNAKDARIAQLEAQINDYLSHSAREREKVEADIAVLVKALEDIFNAASHQHYQNSVIADVCKRYAGNALTRIQGEYRCGEARDA